jgi:AcrR family transcriptional regulator
MLSVSTCWSTRPRPATLTPMPRRGYHHGDLRAALLRAGQALLGEVGPGQLTLREVARRAGVSHAAPYRHFASREALVEAIAAEGFRALTEALRGAVSGRRDPRDRITHLGVAYVRFALGHPGQVRNMFSGLALRDPAALEGEAREAFGVLVAEVRGAQRAGAIAGRDAVGGATTAWALCHGLALLLLPQPKLDPRRADALVRRSLRHIFDGLGR